MSDSWQKDENGTAALILEYTDPVEGFKGWLVRDGLAHRICAGGVRVQKGLTRDHLTRMAKNMTRKMRIAGLRVDGAKSGIDYPPSSPGKRAALTRFMAAIRPYILSVYSMGPDLNVEMKELEEIGAGLAIPSVKMAIAAAQGWDLAYYQERYRVLAQEVNGCSLGLLRAGGGVAAAGLAVLDSLAIPHGQATAAVQGFGTVAKAAARVLAAAGVRIVALADEQTCLLADPGRSLPIATLLQLPGTRLPLADISGCSWSRLPSAAIFAADCDLLIPAAVEGAITSEIAQKIKVRAVVPGANLAVEPAAAATLADRAIVVLPDFLSGCGGSLAMEALFGPAAHPTAAEVLAGIRDRMAVLVRQILDQAAAEKITPTAAALRLCEQPVAQPDGRPYGAL